MSEDFKIPCGDLPERYPRTNAKRYRESSLWDNFGPVTRKKAAESTSDTPTEVHSKCYCCCEIVAKLSEFPIVCCRCRTIHKVEVQGENNGSGDAGSVKCVRRAKGSKA